MLTQRLGFEKQKDPQYIRDLLAIIQKNPGSCDEIWLATDYGYPPLSVHRKSAKQLAEAAALIREAGLRVSLQISNTLGHGDYMGVRDCSGLVYEGSPVEHFVDVYGTEATLSFCWHGAHFRSYLREMLTIYCEAIQPYRVWIDDDFRCDNHSPSRLGCLCDSCLARFCEQYGVSFTREALTRQVAEGDPVWRERFVAFLQDGLCGLAKEMAETVVAASPASTVGYQHGFGVTPAAEGFQDVFKAFQAGSGQSVGSRPGAGTYNDHNPGDMLFKADCIRYQASLVAGAVDEIRPEIENFPHVCFGKSPAGTCYETSVYLAAGANAMSYATMMYDFEPLSWHAELFRGFASHRAYWEKLAALNRDTYEAGLTQYLPRDQWRRPLAEGASPYSWCEQPWYFGCDIQRCGIPISYRMDRPNPLYMLPCEVARTLSDEAIRVLLAHPVFCGGDTLEYLVSRGFGEDFSAAAYGCATLKLFEEFTDDPLNPDGECRRWENGLMQPWGSYLVDRNGETRVLGYYATNGSSVPALTTDPKHPYGIATAVVKTSVGAGWLVCGQNPWSSIISWAKRQQMLSALDELSEKRLPVLSMGREEVVLFPRETATCQTSSVTVLNPTVGVAEGITLRIHRPKGCCAIAYRPDGSEVSLSVQYDGEDMIVVLPVIAPWNTCTVALVEMPQEKGFEK